MYLLTCGPNAVSVYVLIYFCYLHIYVYAFFFFFCMIKYTLRKKSVNHESRPSFSLRKHVWFFFVLLCTSFKSLPFRIFKFWNCNVYYIVFTIKHIELNCFCWWRDMCFYLKLKSRWFTNCSDKQRRLLREFMACFIKPELITDVSGKPDKIKACLVVWDNPKAIGQPNCTPMLSVGQPVSQLPKSI